MKWLFTIVGLSGIISVLIGSASLLGYAIGNETLYVWNKGSMALNTSIVVVLQGVSTCLIALYLKIKYERVLHRKEGKVGNKDL